MLGEDLKRDGSSKVNQSCQFHADMRTCGCGFLHMRIIGILIYAVYADMRIMRMSFLNRIYQQIQTFVFVGIW